MMLSKFDIVEYFRNTIAENEDLSTPVAAIFALVEFVKYSGATTTFEFTKSLEAASEALQTSTKNPVSITAGCDLFMRFVNSATAGYSVCSDSAVTFQVLKSECAAPAFQTSDAGDWIRAVLRPAFFTAHPNVQHAIIALQDVKDLKSDLIKNGQQLVQKARACREKTITQGLPFIKDDAVILVHSYSRVITLLLQRAAEAKRRFRVYVTESQPSNYGKKAAQVLSQLGIPVVVIIDTAVAYFMDKVDMVLVGAEGVVENGGLINHIGTYQVGILAKAADKPVYAVAESFKFVRLFPLNQQDFRHSTDMIQYTVENGTARRPAEAEGQETTDPSVDYTPPQYITLLFTDLGVLTPSGVGDSLITMWSD